MKKIILSITALMFVFVGYKSLPSGNETPGTMSGGAPSASTGAPDERHCATSGCHSDFALNSGAAELSVSLGNGVTQYELGKTYPVTVSISNPGLIRFGFQAVALKNSDNTNAGTIRLVDSQRTQILPGFGSTIDRKYVTYTYEGTNAVSAGLGKWDFEWTAPETNEGPITLYIASIAANDDGTDAGDHTYTKQISMEAPAIFWSVYPSVSSSKFSVQSSGAPILGLRIFNSAGDVVYSKADVEPGILSLELDLSPGVYFLSAIQNGKTEVRKIVISR